MTFSRTDFDADLTDIENYLGYLRGNENFLAYWNELRESFALKDGDDTDGLVPVTLWLAQYYDKVPCPESRFAFKPREGVFSLRIYVRPPWTEEQSKALMDSIVQSLNFAYQDGLAWASGVAAYCRSVCDQMTEPDVFVLAEAIRTIGADAITPLLGPDGDVAAYSDDWALVGGVVQQWKGSAGVNAASLYDNFDYVTHAFANLTGWMNYGFCSYAVMLRDVQTGLQGSVEKVRGALVDQLDEWVDIGYQPSEEPEPLPAWVADVKTIAGDALTIINDKVPVIGNITEKVENLVTEYEQWKTLVEDIESATGFDILPKLDKPVYLRTAEEIYTGLTDVLYNDYLQAYRDSLDVMQTGNIPTDYGVPTPEDAQDGGGAYSGQRLLEQLNDSASQTTFPRVDDASVYPDESYT